jgi:filamentous hemagglutinin family protein
MGRTQQFAEVIFAKPQPEGKIITTEITSASTTQLHGRVA